ncbi:transmembrane protein 79-like isoform X3 [Nerophis ophidion]|uniref:transmembrane protein 79-like isoform X3 n=1 Tax=Nerophis ophidion TaxID=159077 RepID=UPI002AE03501|nr:transmembrane protein 79-like isoform X3 [Nerophis ophidion]
METPSMQQDIQTEDSSSCVSAKEKKSGEREEPEGNFLPEKAAQVFHFAATRPLSPSRRSEALWGKGYEGPEDTPQPTGWLVLGVSRLRFGLVRPSLDYGEDEQQPEGVGLHRSFTSDSVALFLLHFLQLVVMAIYLRQEHLKLVPLLAIMFALGRLAYWVAAAFGSSVRGFGFGLTFLPILVMATINMVFIYDKDPSWIFRLPHNMEVLALPTSRQRFWG